MTQNILNLFFSPKKTLKRHCLVQWHLSHLILYPHVSTMTFTLITWVHTHPNPTLQNNIFWLLMHNGLSRGHWLENLYMPMWEGFLCALGEKYTFKLPIYLLLLSLIYSLLITEMSCFLGCHSVATGNQTQLKLTWSTTQSLWRELENMSC